MFRGKKYQDAAKQIEKNTQYDAAEGFGLICKTASAKFDEIGRASCRERV